MYAENKVEALRKINKPSATAVSNHAHGGLGIQQVKLFDAAVKDLRQNYARRSIEMIEVFARAKKKVTERSRVPGPRGRHKGGGRN